MDAQFDVLVISKHWFPFAQHFRPGRGTRRCGDSPWPGRAPGLSRLPGDRRHVGFIRRVTLSSVPKTFHQKAASNTAVCKMCLVYDFPEKLVYDPSCIHLSAQHTYNSFQMHIAAFHPHWCRVSNETSPCIRIQLCFNLHSTNKSICA